MPQDRFFLESGTGTVTEITSDVLIGRGSDCDFLLTEGHPSRRHAMLRIGESGATLEDLDSANGTFVNHARIAEQRLLKHGDIVTFGSCSFTFRRESASATAEQTALAPQTDREPPDGGTKTEVATEHVRYALASPSKTFNLRFATKLIVGRSAAGDSIDLAIDNDGVSGVHAELYADDQGVWITDLKSANGTFVNDVRATGRVLARHGDRIRFHLAQFVVDDREAPPLTEAADDSEEIGLQGGTVMVPVSIVPDVWRKDGSSTARLSKVDASVMPDTEALQQIAETADAPTLIVLSGDEAGHSHRLERSGDVSYWDIGRDPDKHNLSIVLKDPSVSDFHARVVCQRGRWKIVDQMSTNSVFVNEQQHATAFLSSGDYIRLGAVGLVFGMPELPAEEAASDARPKGSLWRRLLGRGNSD